jgi:small-conductance mechanosensitive channel
MGLTRLLVALCAWLSVGIAAAQVAPAEEGVAARESRLREIATDLASDDPELLDLREELREIRLAAERAAAAPRAELADLLSALDRLGPPPEEGGIPEAPSIAAERARLNAAASELDARVRQSELNSVEAQRLIAAIADRRREIFFAELLDRGTPPFTPAIVVSAWQTLTEGVVAARSAVSGWWAEKLSAGTARETLIILAAAVLLALALWIPIRNRLNREILDRVGPLEPLPSRRVLVAAARAVARLLPVLLGGILLLEALRLVGAIPESAVPFANAFWLGFLAVFFADGAAVGIFAPQHPRWRVVDLEGWQARAIRVLLVLAALVVAADIVLGRGAAVFGNSDALVILRRTGTSLLLALILWALCFRSLWRRPAQAVPATGSVKWSRARQAGRLIALVAVVGALIGYVALAHYLTTRTFVLLGLAAVIYLFRALLREGVRLVDRRFRSLKSDEPAEERLLYFWIGVVIDVVAIAAFVPPALLVLGAEWGDVRSWVTDAFLGFRIGGVTISLAQILTAFALFFGLLYATRTVQRTAETRFFPRSRLDAGVQNSFKTIIGYIGLVVAFAVGVSALGFDLSNLAIIAGALSVGIGFGLQSIVNNFVSGLILLFERPIKVGDWIVTQSGEGIVKRISVRSTEIETFDRSSVIVPNAELISGAVTNWTHKNRIGRIIIPVGVSYNSDPEQVVEILMQVAREDPDIVETPEYYVYFVGYGDSSLDLELRGYIADVGATLSTRTRLRISIFKKLKEAGIEIPFPQRDVHLKTPWPSGLERPERPAGTDDQR